jgi:geranyl-CoA carboxylase alpha subunit
MVDFHSAATVEFLLDSDGNHYFLEMNTRLQVEHGVTELVTGIDIVAWQIRIAAGEALERAVVEPRASGHAIEVRIYAEDPYDGFRPAAGSVTTWRAPDGPGVRVDHALREGAPLTSDYDPLLAKLMVHGANRPAAIGRLRRALDETLIGGVQTDLGFHRWLIDQPDFASGRYHTGLVAEAWADGPALEPESASLAGFAAAEARRAWVERAGPASGRSSAGEESEWRRQARHEALRQ